MATYTYSKGSLGEYRTRKELYTPEFCKHTMFKCFVQSHRSLSWRCHDCGTWFYFKYKTDDPKKDRDERKVSDPRPAKQRGATEPG